MMLPDTGGPRVEGIMMQKLRAHLQTHDPVELQRHVNEWSAVRDAFLAGRDDFELAGAKFRKAFGDTSMTADEGERAFRKAADEMVEKAAHLDRAIASLAATRSTMIQAKNVLDQAQAGLPTSHGAPPDPSDVRFATTGVGGRLDNARRLAEATAEWKAVEDAIADAERRAAEQCDLIAASFADAAPDVRRVSAAPYTPPATPEGSEFPGGASIIAAARAKIGRTNSSTLYADGMGHEIIDRERATIAEARTENIPEWDQASGRWINADGSPAPSAAYAGVFGTDGDFTLLPGGGDDTGSTLDCGATSDSGVGAVAGGARGAGPAVAGGAFAGLAVTAGAVKMLGARMAAVRAGTSVRGSSVDVAAMVRKASAVASGAVLSTAARTRASSGTAFTGPSSRPRMKSKSLLTGSEIEARTDDQDIATGTDPDPRERAVRNPLGIDVSVLRQLPSPNGGTHDVLSGRAASEGLGAAQSTATAHMAASAGADAAALDGAGLDSADTSDLPRRNPAPESIRARGIDPGRVRGLGPDPRRLRRLEEKAKKKRKDREDQEQEADEDDEWADLDDEPPRR